MGVTCTSTGFVTTITLSRPARRNAVDGPTATALREAFTAFEQDADARVAVLWGAGGHFCAGADLVAVAEGTAGFSLDPQGPGPMGPTRMQLTKPVIAAISGYAVAGGLELALWCDLRVAEQGSTLGVFCRRFGVPLIDGGTVRLPRLIGQSRALDLLLTGRAVDTSEALAMGLVNRVVPKGQALHAAQQLAGEIATHPQRCLRADRASLYGQWDMSLAEALVAEGAAGLDILAHESLAGAKKFAEGAGRHGATVAPTTVPVIDIAEDD